MQDLHVTNDITYPIAIIIIIIIIIIKATSNAGKLQGLAARFDNMHGEALQYVLGFITVTQASVSTCCMGLLHHQKGVIQEMNIYLKLQICCQKKTLSCKCSNTSPRS